MHEIIIKFECEPDEKIVITRSHKSLPLTVKSKINPETKLKEVTVVTESEIFCNITADMFGPGQNQDQLDMIHITVTIIFIQNHFQPRENLDQIILLGPWWLRTFLVIFNAPFIVALRIIKIGYIVRG